MPKLSPEEKISKARIQLLSRQPFWGTLVLHLNFVKCTFLPTMGVNHLGTVYYSEEFVERLSIEELKGVLAHEVGHVMLRHLERLGKRDPYKANIAMDLALNLIIRREFVLPRGALIDERWKGMAWEEIYDKLPDDPLRSARMCTLDCSKCPFRGTIPRVSKDGVICRQGSLDRHIFGDKLEQARGPNGKLDKQKLRELGLPEELADLEPEKHVPNWRRIVKDAFERAKIIGKLPLGMERLIDDLVEPKLSWRELLARLVTRSIPFNFSYRRPSRKSIVTDIYFPSLEKEKVELIACVDTSGSMSSEEVKDGIGELLGILRSFKSVEILLFSCDSRLYDANKVASEYDLRVARLKGGGGTDFRPIFRWIRENRPRAKVLVYFTDAYGVFPLPGEVPSNLTVIWVVSKKGDPSRIPTYFPCVVSMKDYSL